MTLRQPRATVPEENVMARTVRLKGEELARWYADRRLAEDQVVQHDATSSQPQQRVVPPDEQTPPLTAPQ